MTATPTDAIPEDIDWIATDIVRTPFGVDGDPEWEMYITIARAILAERERCRLIAVDVAQEADGGEYYIAHVIASAISKANPNSARGS